MTFKIDKLGFYKMRNGDKCEVVFIRNGKAASPNNKGDFCTYDLEGTYQFDHPAFRNFDIIAEWKEPKKVMVPEVNYILNNDGTVGIFARYDDKLQVDGFGKFIKTIPAHEVEVNE